MQTSTTYLPCPALQRIGFSALLALLTLLTGCAHVRNMPDDVTSPPPPLVGSAPIMAHDAFARAMFLPSSLKETTLVMVVRSSAGSPRTDKPDGPGKVPAAGVN